MMDDYQQRATFPSLPPHAITVSQPKGLDPFNHPDDIDARTSHSCQVRQVLQGVCNIRSRGGVCLLLVVVIIIIVVHLTLLWASLIHL